MAQARPERHALDVVERDAEVVRIEQQRLAGRVAAQLDDLIVFPVSGAPTENERSMEMSVSSLSSRSSTTPLTRKAVAGTGDSATGSVG